MRVRKRDSKWEGKGRDEGKAENDKQKRKVCLEVGRSERCRKDGRVKGAGGKRQFKIWEG